MRRFLAALGGCVLLGGAACAPQAQGEPTSTPTSVPRILMDESFVHAWPDDQRGSAWFAEGGYRLSTRRPGEFVAVRAPLANVPGDVIVSGTFRKVGGPPGGGYGLILADQRIGAGDGVDQSGQFIVAGVGDRGDIGVWRRDGERWTDLVPWTPSKAVHTDADANDLSVQVLGGRLTFTVNGDQVANLARVDAFGVRPGGVGLYTGGDLNEVVVSRFRVQAPGRSVDLRQVQGQPAAFQPKPESRPPEIRPAVGPPARQEPPSTTPGRLPAPSDAERVRDLLAGIAGDVGAIAESFSGGLDNPHDPVNDPATLKRDAAHLADATTRANELWTEIQRLQARASGGR